MTTILVVEDEAVIARDLWATLKDLGYTVPQPVASADHALTAIAAQRPDLVLMDIRIRGNTDGIALATRIRDDHDIPVVYMTSHSDEATVARARATGAYGYLLKPFTERVLRIAIEVALTKHDIEKRVQEKERERTTTRLQSVNRQLETVTYSLAHDLRTPLRAIHGFAEILADDYRDKLDASGIDCLDEIRGGVLRMGRIMDALLSIAQLTCVEIRPEPTDLSALARVVAGNLAVPRPARPVKFVVSDGHWACIDPTLARILFENLLGNARKFTSRVAAPQIEVGAEDVGAELVFFVRDNGAGFDMAHSDKLFVPFQSLHAPGEYNGTKVGLAISRGIVNRHGGRIWGEGAVGQGATIFFSLPKSSHSGGVA